MRPSTDETKENMEGDTEDHEDLSRHRGHCGPAHPPHKKETIKMSFLKKGRLYPQPDKASAHTFSLVGMGVAGSQ